MELCDYKDMVNYLTTDTLPCQLYSSTKFSRLNYINLASTFQLGEDGHLYKIYSLKNKNTVRLLYPTKDEVPEILRLHHDPEHSGINHTTEMIQAKYRWKGMHKHIRDYEFKEFHATLIVDNRATTAYRPQGNGLVEAHNKILKKKISKMISENDSEWPQKLQLAVFSANSHRKRSTGYSAFQLMYGRDFDHLPLIRLLSNNYPPEETMVEEEAYEPGEDNFWTIELEQQRCLERDNARTNIKIEQTKQKRSYDMKVEINRPQIKTGDLFVVLDMAKEKKMPGTNKKPKYKGPFQVTNMTDSHLIAKKDEKMMKYPIHLTRKYYPRLDEDIKSDGQIVERKRSSDLIIQMDSISNAKSAKVTKECSSTFTYGIPHKAISCYLTCMKEEIIKHIRSKTYLSQLHQDLCESKLRVVRQPISILLDVMKDKSRSEMLEETINCLVKWTTTAFSEMSTPPREKAFDYVYQILLATVIEYIEEKLIISRCKEDLKLLPYTIRQHSSLLSYPLYSPISKDWQISKCNLLGIPFEKELSQANYYIGQPLGGFIPLELHPIEPDGNCFFRAISAVLSGSQDYHKKLRGEIYRFIAVQGASLISRYLEVKFNGESPREYLLRSNMDTETIWATDVEIIATSFMLDVDLFVANEHSDTKKTWNQIRWYRYHPNKADYTKQAIYINNVHDHFEPVTDLINCRYQSYFNSDSFSGVVVLDDE